MLFKSILVCASCDINDSCSNCEFSTHTKSTLHRFFFFSIELNCNMQIKLQWNCPNEIFFSKVDKVRNLATASKYLKLDVESRNSAWNGNKFVFIKCIAPHTFRHFSNSHVAFNFEQSMLFFTQFPILFIKLTLTYHFEIPFTTVIFQTNARLWAMCENVYYDSLCTDWVKITLWPRHTKNNKFLAGVVVSSEAKKIVTELPSRFHSHLSSSDGIVAYTKLLRLLFWLELYGKLIRHSMRFMKNGVFSM